MVATLNQNVIEDGVTATKAQDFTLDAAGGLSITKNLTGTVSLVESTNHYDGEDDSPAWTETKTRPDAATGWATTWNRNVAALSGDMGIIASSDGTAKILLANLHNDIAASVTVGDTGIESYSEFTEYGLARDKANTPERYGWLGTKQRDASAAGGLTLMGVRLTTPRPDVSCHATLSKEATTTPTPTPSTPSTNSISAASSGFPRSATQCLAGVSYAGLLGYLSKKIKNPYAWAAVMMFSATVIWHARKARNSHGCLRYRWWGKLSHGYWCTGSCKASW